MSTRFKRGEDEISPQYLTGKGGNMSTIFKRGEAEISPQYLKGKRRKSVHNI